MKNIKHICGFCKSNNIVKLYNEEVNHTKIFPLACENCGATWEVKEKGEVELVCEPQALTTED